MNSIVRRGILMATVFGTGVIGIAGLANAQAQGDPPGRVARLAFEQGTVSFHDGEDTGWTAAAVNDALTTGDSLWTEPNSRSEVSVAGTRVRLDPSTQLDLLQIDDSRTRLQLDQGRLDIKTFTMDTAQPYEIVTPRGTVKLEAQGDYYIESGSTEDPTRLGVRAGAAQITGLNGQVLAVRAGEVGEITGDAATPQLRTIKAAPPPMPSYWAQRDRQISYAAPQYLSADVVGYEDMQAYGSWSNDPEYGEVWAPNSVPDGWRPYYTGRWAYSQPYGWTWVDEQPWGFAPYHYGRWANRNNRWYWVPPERRERAVYAPALVAFMGGVEFGVAIGHASAAPVGWFPLGPREAYVPPYTHDRAYYERINTNARVERAVMDDRWQRAERHEAIQANQQNERMANRRFATVIPAAAFVGQQHVNRVALKVSADKIAAAPVAAVSAPPAPTQSMAVLKAGDPKVQAEAHAKAEAEAKAHGNFATANTRFNGGQELGRPAQAQRAEQQHPAPGPKVAAHTQPPAVGAKPTLPPLAPRHGAPPPAIQGERAPAPQPNAAQPNRTEPNRAAPARAEPPKPGQPATPPAPQANRPEPPKPGETPHPPQAQQKPGENGHPPVPPAHQAETRRAPQQAAPQVPHPAPHPPQQRPAETHAVQPQQHQTPPPAHRPEVPQPPHQAAAPHPQPQRAAEPPPAQHAPAPPPQQAHAPAPPPQAHAPDPQPRHQAVPPQQAHVPAPPPQAAHPAPPPQVAHPAPAPQVHPAPQQAQQKNDKEKK